MYKRQGIKSADTFTRWRTHYLSHGSFRRDRRGRFTSGFMLRHDDLKLALTKFLLSKLKKDINISDVSLLACACIPLSPSPSPHSQQTRDFINEKLLKEFPIGTIDKASGLRRPVSYETTHQWMLTCGCSYNVVRKSYYNDTHERHDNQLDRVTKSYRHAFVGFREEKWWCISPEQKQTFESQYPNWPHDQFAVRIPKHDVGAFPPQGGTPYYQRQKEFVASDEPWFEYHIDFLPEELVFPLNSGRGGFVSQQRSVKMPVAAPRSNDQCIERLCDLLTVSCPQTLQLLQNQVDRVAVGSHITHVRVCCMHACMRVCVYIFFIKHARTHTHARTHAHTHTHAHTRKSFMVSIIMQR